MLAADAQATMRGEPLAERDPLRLLAKLRALRESGAISATEFEIRKSAGAKIASCGGDQAAAGVRMATLRAVGILCS